MIGFGGRDARFARAQAGAVALTVVGEVSRGLATGWG